MASWALLGSREHNRAAMQSQSSVGVFVTDMQLLESLRYQIGCNNIRNTERLGYG